MQIKNDSTGYEMVILGLIVAGLAGGGFAYGLGLVAAARWVWLVTLIAGALPLLQRIITALWQRKMSVDVIAMVAIVASIWAQQYVAGVVIVVMLSGGQALESFAQGRAKKALKELLSRAPVIAHIKQADGALVDVDVARVRLGDVVVIKAGEVIPVDGVVTDGISNVDEAIITGESLPQEKNIGSLVFSGSVNTERALQIRATATSADSKYQTIVQLVEAAQNIQAPVVRLADRYALFFNGITFVMAGAAWLLFHDPVRVLAVLVVASPCPLILATPIAMISGVGRAALRGIIVKSGAALETLGRVKALVFDKTGTLTLGTPEVVGIVSVSPLSDDQVLALAASLDQLSVHMLARSLIAHAQKKSLALDYPQEFREVFGQGVAARIKNQPYFFGKMRYIAAQKISISPGVAKQYEDFQHQGKMVVYLSTDKQLLGYIVFADVVRPETKAMFALIARHAISKVIMLTGDKQSVADTIAKSVGVSEYHAELLPEDKADLMAMIRKKYGPVAMVGDGVNDAPAMAVADVGIAIADHGATAASEASDVVIMVGNMNRVHDVIHIAQRTMKIAKQGIWFGMGVSMILMVLALLGYVAPVPGALMQEVLDVVVIANALRIHFEKIS